MLVVEDNPMNQLVAPKVLERFGCSFDVAGNGRLAVEALRTTSYAVLIDCQMPEMDGYQATAGIRGLDGEAARTPIIAMTAAAMDGDREACLEAGMDDYLTKPLRPDVVAAALVRWTAGARSRPPMPRAPDDVASTAQEDGAEGAAPALDEERMAMLRALDDGGGHLLEALAGQFLAQADEARTALAAAMDTRNAAQLARTAHLLKGAAANLGASELALICAELEHGADDGYLDEVPLVLGRLDDELARARTALEVFRAERAR